MSKRLEVLPADTSISITQTYKLRVRLLDANAAEFPRDSYTATFTPDGTGRVRVVDGDIVQPLDAGMTGVTVTVRTSSGSLSATAIVRIGVPVRD